MVIKHFISFPFIPKKDPYSLKPSGISSPRHQNKGLFAARTALLRPMRKAGVFLQGIICFLNFRQIRQGPLWA